MLQAIHLSGTIRFADDTQMPLSVGLYQDGYPIDGTRIDAGGHFDILANPGQGFTLGIIGTPNQDYAAPASWSVWAGLSVTTSSFSLAQDTELNLVLPAYERRLNASVVDTSGQPIPNAALYNLPTIPVASFDIGNGLTASGSQSSNSTPWATGANGRGVLHYFGAGPLPSSGSVTAGPPAGSSFVSNSANWTASGGDASVTVTMLGR